MNTHDTIALSVIGLAGLLAVGSLTAGVPAQEQRRAAKRKAYESELAEYSARMTDEQMYWVRDCVMHHSNGNGPDYAYGSCVNKSRRLFQPRTSND